MDWRYMMKITLEKEIYIDCRLCVNAIKDKNGQVIGCRNGLDKKCNYEERQVDIMCDLMDCKDCRHLCKNEINDYEVEKLWEEFEDVLFIEDEDSDDSCSLVLSDDWQGWNRGTNRDTIWHWFDEHHSKGIHWLLYGTE